MSAAVTVDVRTLIRFLLVGHARSSNSFSISTPKSAIFPYRTVEVFGKRGQVDSNATQRSHLGHFCGLYHVGHAISKMMGSPSLNGNLGLCRLDPIPSYTSEIAAPSCSLNPCGRAKTTRRPPLDPCRSLLRRLLWQAIPAA